MRDRIAWWVLSVYVLGLFPIVVHLIAETSNDSDVTRPKDYGRIFASDAYLYAFIIGLAGVVDALGDSKERKSVTLAFIVAAFGAGFFNFLLLDDQTAGNRHLGVFFRVFAWIVLVGIFGLYTWYKLFTFHEAADEDKAEESTRERNTPKKVTAQE